MRLVNAAISIVSCYFRFVFRAESKNQISRLGFIFQSWLIIRLNCYIFSFLRAFSYNWILFISLITADMDDGAKVLDTSADSRDNG